MPAEIAFFWAFLVIIVIFNLIMVIDGGYRPRRRKRPRRVSADDAADALIKRIEQGVKK